MHIAAPAALAKKHTIKIKQQRVVAQNLVHAVIKKKRVPMIRSPVTPKKNLALVHAATSPARQ